MHYEGDLITTQLASSTPERGGDIPRRMVLFPRELFLPFASNGLGENPKARLEGLTYSI